jgi:hypothetical protein
LDLDFDLELLLDFEFLSTLTDFGLPLFFFSFCVFFFDSFFFEPFFEFFDSIKGSFSSLFDSDLSSLSEFFSSSLDIALNDNLDCFKPSFIALDFDSFWNFL